MFNSHYANGKFSPLRILHYISLFIIIELAMWYSACMESACSQIPFFFSDHPLHRLRHFHRTFSCGYHKLSLGHCGFECLCLFCSASMCAKCAATPCNLHWLRLEGGEHGSPSLILRHGGGGGQRAPGTHCLRMRRIATEFCGSCAHTYMCTY